MPRKNVIKMPDMVRYRELAAEAQRQADAAWKEIGRVNGLLIGAKDDKIPLGVEHRVKCLRGHLRALKDCQAQVARVQELIHTLYSEYVP